MPAVTEMMNLKEAFAYMNFVGAAVKKARGLLSQSQHYVDIRLSEEDNYLYDVRRLVRYSEVDAGMEDSESAAESQRTYDVTADELIRFLDEARLERERCSEAILAAKKTLPRDLDLEISVNKERHELISKYRELLALRNSRTESLETCYRFDNDGRQTAYSVPATVVSTIAFDRGAVRSKAEELTQQAKTASAWIDKAMISTEVEFAPRWSTSDEFEDMIAGVRE